MYKCLLLHMIDQFPLICDGIKKKATLEINVSLTCEFDNSTTTFNIYYSFSIKISLPGSLSA